MRNRNVTHNALVAFSLAGLLAVAGCSSGGDANESETSSTPATEATTTEAPTTEAPTPETVMVMGAMLLPLGGYDALELPRGDSECSAAGPVYSDIVAGVQVQVTDASNTIVGTGELAEATIFADPATGENSLCTWTFLIEVPAGGSYYTVKALDWSSEAVAEDELETTTIVISPATS